MNVLVLVVVLAGTVQAQEDCGTCLGGGAIAGAVIGTLIGCIIIGLIIFFCLRRKRQREGGYISCIWWAKSFLV